MKTRLKTCCFSSPLFCLLLVATGWLGYGSELYAQENTTARQSLNWNTGCSSLARRVPLNCTMEQRVLIRETGKQFARIVIQTTSGSSPTVTMMAELPLGLSIADGLTLKIDNAEPKTLAIQTCEASGCYASTLVDEELLELLVEGVEMSMNFSNLQKQIITLPISLIGFSDSYDKIK